MKLYHFTTLANWQRIQQSVLEPRRIIWPATVKSQGWPEVYGIWTLQDKPTAEQEAALVLYMIARHGTPDIVQLEIDMPPASLLAGFDLEPGGKRLTINYTFNIEQYSLRPNMPSAIIKTHVPLDRIKLLRHYDVIKQLTQS
jgi:hypothetical protein